MLKQIDMAEQIRLSALRGSNQIVVRQLFDLNCVWASEFGLKRKTDNGQQGQNLVP